MELCCCLLSRSRCAEGSQRPREARSQKYQSAYSRVPLQQKTIKDMWLSYTGQVDFEFHVGRWQRLSKASIFRSPLVQNDFSPQTWQKHCGKAQCMWQLQRIRAAPEASESKELFRHKFNRQMLQQVDCRCGGAAATARQFGQS